ncbi:hypothetical protein IHE45_14G042300 [Dioscorea alata]|uniref:Uncharacterized protein n=1 Tax=Dioscorea alata TaxID=55571 RepID=A0ACB7URC1_DIOAL|nr:hypothetical protein IHE45_14G042300 [Dioscorea alata]
MKKTKFVKPGTIASYLRAQHKLRRSQAHGNVVHTRDHALEEATQTNHDQEHEVQMEQEMSIGLKQQGLDHIVSENQQEINQNCKLGYLHQQLQQWPLRMQLQAQQVLLH